MSKERKREVLQQPPPRRYSAAFKRKVIREIESGLMSKEGARRRYGILGHSTVLKWYRRYSKFATGELTIQLRMGDTRATHAELAQRIKDLERALALTSLKTVALETMIDLAEKTYEIDIRKNSGAKPSLPSDPSVLPNE